MALGSSQSDWAGGEVVVHFQLRKVVGVKQGIRATCFQRCATQSIKQPARVHQSGFTGGIVKGPMLSHKPTQSRGMHEGTGPFWQRAPKKKLMNTGAKSHTNWQRYRNAIWVYFVCIPLCCDGVGGVVANQLINLAPLHIHGQQQPCPLS